MTGLSAAIAASASALSAQRMRIEVAVSNIANAESTRGVDDQPYRRRHVTLVPEQVGAFDDALGMAGATGVRVESIVQDQTPSRVRYEPSHPDADENGFIALPNVDTAEEMIDMLEATRAYQASLAAIGLIRETMTKALELGR